MTVLEGRPDFSKLFSRSGVFDRAVASCAEAQRLVSLSAQTMSHTWASCANASRLRRTAVQVRQAWAEAEAVHSVLRNEVERVARTLRDAGVDDRAAVATVRAHLRFVLYDGGLAEQDAEPVVARASSWVAQVYAAA